MREGLSGLCQGPSSVILNAGDESFAGLSLAELARQAAGCTLCALSQTRNQVVFAEGNPQALLMLIGEGPGQHEDDTGRPFVGRAGQLLTQLLASVDITRPQDLYICNTVKCRPPQNRKPEPAELAACFPYLEGQIREVKPRLILLAGATAVKDILKTKVGISKLRGQWFDTQFAGAKAMPIFHPSYLLRNQSQVEGSPRWLMAQDLREVRCQLDALGQFSSC